LPILIEDSVYNKIKKTYVDLEIERSCPEAADQKPSEVRFAALEFEMTPRWESHRCPKLTVQGRRHDEAGYQHDVNRLRYGMREAYFGGSALLGGLGEGREAGSRMPTPRAALSILLPEGENAQ
jgi:hypothetical protein